MGKFSPDEMIEKLYREMFAQLFKYAWNALDQNKSLAEEAVQDTFRIACMNSKALSESPNPNGWLVLTLRNVVRNILRQQATAIKYSAHTMLSSPRNTNTRELEENIDIMYSGIVRDEDFLMLKRIALDKASLLDVSQEFGISVEASRKRVKRAKEQMKSALEKII